ncbi:MAG TPA: RNA polymerase sigma factor [Oculatellaceae cyanobacterium]|jgi:RNA polymerase sigma-70 factor (ECF subfamily)
MTYTSSSTLKPAQVSESELLAAAAKGDQKAFRVLVNQYLPLVYNYLYRMTQNHELSEEMSQETFVKAYRNLKTFDCRRPFKPWLLRIAANATLSELRKQRKVVSLNALQEDGGFNEMEHQVSEDMTLRLEQELDAHQVQQALNRLDEKYRNVLLLRYQQELSYEEIASAMQTPLNTVRTWLKRGLEKFKDTIQEIAV